MPSPPSDAGMHPTVAKLMLAAELLGQTPEWKAALAKSRISPSVEDPAEIAVRLAAAKRQVGRPFLRVVRGGRS